MRKLIFFLLLPIFSFAQKDTINNATITVGNTTYSNVTIIIPKQSSVAGVNSVNGRSGNVVLSKSDVGLGNVDNTADLLKPISNATQIALNGKQNAGGGGGGWPDTINLGEQKQLLFIKPFNYGKIYPNGRQQAGWGMMGYSTHENVNPDGIPDQVWQDPASYNSYPNGGRINPKDISTSSRTELYYYIPGIGYSVERHVFEYTDEDGGVHRTLSYYGRRKDGMGGFWNMEGTISGFLPQLPFAAPRQFFFLNDASITLTATQMGRRIGLIASDAFNNSNIEFSSTGGVYNLHATSSLGSTWHKDGYGHDDDGLKVYLNDAAAKADGLKFHDGYYRIINGIETRVRVTTL